MNHLRSLRPSRERSCRAARLGGPLVCALVAAGCHHFDAPWFEPPPVVVGPPPVAATGQVLVPSLDRDLVWDQVVDVVDDYFRVQREERIRLVGDILTEGRLDTYPRTGSTIFEPWNNDSVNAYERWESTLQSIRRRATVRVIPAEAGYLVEVMVMKDLEDVPRPETGAISLANSQALRNDDSLLRVTNPVGGQQPNAGWIELGRDTALESVILAQIQGRLGGQGIPVQF